MFKVVLFILNTLDINTPDNSMDEIFNGDNENTNASIHSFNNDSSVNIINTIYDESDKVKNKFIMTLDNINKLKEYVKLESQIINVQNKPTYKKKTLFEINNNLSQLSFNIDKYFLKPISRYEKKLTVKKNEDEKIQSNPAENTKKEKEKTYVDSEEGI